MIPTVYRALLKSAVLENGHRIHTTKKNSSAFGKAIIYLYTIIVDVQPHTYVHPSKRGTYRSFQQKGCFSILNTCPRLHRYKIQDLILCTTKSVPVMECQSTRSMSPWHIWASNLHHHAKPPRRVTAYGVRSQLLEGRECRASKAVSRKKISNGFRRSPVAFVNGGQTSAPKPRSGTCSRG